MSRTISSIVISPEASKSISLYSIAVRCSIDTELSSASNIAATNSVMPLTLFI